MGLIPSTVRSVRSCGGPAYLTGPCCGRRDWPASGRGARGGDRGRAGGPRRRGVQLKPSGSVLVRAAGARDGGRFRRPGLLCTELVRTAN